MKCPVCSYEDSKVIDSRPVDGSNSIRRRRECPACHTRFTTYEVVDTLTPFVIKKDGSRELFDSNKLLAGLLKACEKRPVDPQAVTEEIAAAIKGSMKTDIPSKQIGEMVMDRLKELDEVAYVRFASVYREFKDIDSFMKEISALKNSPKHKDK
ncbi:MAG: transcriptional repressor NrdR [Ruminococcaceae bacterium]|nr:transcriptional repressor NrdR [Oscillospiraceae bacterium]